ncbi:hypothetical protein JXQ31_05545 [candidate division KSB1 bacterium]|nr:hypothetical protein [candidate division KSB1 bacterium]
MKNSFKFLMVAVVAVVFLFVSLDSAFADTNKGKVVFYKDKSGSFFKFSKQAKSNNKVAWQKNLDNPKEPVGLNSMPVYKKKVFQIDSKNDYNFIQIYLKKLKKVLRVYQY